MNGMDATFLHRIYFSVLIMKFIERPKTIDANKFWTIDCDSNESLQSHWHGIFTLFFCVYILSSVRWQCLWRIFWTMYATAVAVALYNELCGAVNWSWRQLLTNCYSKLVWSAREIIHVECRVPRLLCALNASLIIQISSAIPHSDVLGGEGNYAMLLFISFNIFEHLKYLFVGGVPTWIAYVLETKVDTNLCICTNHCCGGGIKFRSFI